MKLSFYICFALAAFFGFKVKQTTATLQERRNEAQPELSETKFIFPPQFVYRDYQIHRPRVNHYPRSSAFSVTIGLTSMVLAIAFAKATHDDDDEFAVLVGCVAEHLGRGFKPVERDVAENMALVQAMFADFTRFLSIGEYAFCRYFRDNNVPGGNAALREIFRYVQDFLLNGITGTVPFPTAFVANPWIQMPPPILPPMDVADDDDADSDVDNDAENDENDENGPAVHAALA